MVFAAAGFLASGSAAVSETVTIQPEDIKVIVRFEDNTAIPKGSLEVSFKGQDTHKDTQDLDGKVQLSSSGKSKTLEFSLASPSSTATTSPTLQLVANLKRSDGWLLARGSAKLKPATPVDITLYKVMY
ncbi:hypothetical protein [Flexibacterium corallicola]|uniref:hypothetical protein n=1 Tax=Flexibacterium corallicola TaxID=3037259 RepID=UPI00286FAA25|nr:hypothetical protein [Pseudovibrio sp. M1P-2-3]